MNNELSKFLQETIVHKQYVLEGCKIMTDYLIEQGEDELASKLTVNCINHDNSKFTKEEIESFLSIIDAKEGMTDPNVKMNDIVKKAVELHWSNNSHHPEHFNDITAMGKLNLIEMAIDCYSRSIQFGTDLLSFIEIRQKERFKMPEEQYEEYKKYCTILVERGKKVEPDAKVFKKIKDK